MATDTKSPGEKTLSVTPTKTLTLKPRSETGVVRQSFSHGRSKAVVVEKVKRRIERPGEPKPAAAAPAAAPKPSGVVLRTLTKEEQDRRAHALGDAKVREAEERKIAEE